MVKRFREIVEATKKHRSDKDPNWEMRPKDSVLPKVSAPNEQEFVDKHVVKDFSVSPAGSDDVVNARSMKKTNKHDPSKDRSNLDASGEKPTRQGSSPTVSFNKWTGKAPTSRTPQRRGDNREGDSPSKPLRLSPSAVDPSIKDGIKESVFDKLSDAISFNSPIEVVFADGDTATITPETAERLLAIESKLSKPNAATFKRKLNESPSIMMSLLNLGR